MSIKKVTTPITLLVEEMEYSLARLSFAADGSIYLSIPNKKHGYKVSETSGKLEFKNLPGKVRLSSEREGLKEPYLSYHPGSNSIHTNMKENGQKQALFEDLPILNLAEDKKHKLFPLAQILFPPKVNVYADIFTMKNKYSPPLKLQQSNEPKKDVGLSIEVWIHPNGSYLDLDTIPHKEIRKNMSAAQFHNQNLAEHTATVIASEIAVTSDRDIDPITVSVMNDLNPYIFTLLPFDDIE